MRKWLTALVAVAAISLGVVLAEVKDGKTDGGSRDAAACCCCSKSCPK